MSVVGVALKEWASIVAAVGDGSQCVLLRKGGIHDPGGTFRVEHDRFWLYPTWLHQQEAGLEVPRPEAGAVTLEVMCEVVRVWHVADLEQVERLAGLHRWSAEAVATRFHYRRPGLFVVLVRAHRASPHRVAETPAYMGCKSWVELEQPLEVREAAAVVDDEAFAAVAERVTQGLCPPGASALSVP